MHIDSDHTGKRVAVIGGGASGCMAAIAAAEAGCRVTLLEKNDKLAKKIYATGNGRCNLTNFFLDASCYHTGPDDCFCGRFSGGSPETENGTGGESLRRILSWIRQYSPEDLTAFFKEAGVLLHDREGWVYPRTDQAQTIVRALEKRIRALGIEVCLQACVDGIRVVERASEPLRASGFHEASGTRETRKPNTKKAAGAAPEPAKAGKTGRFLLSFSTTAADALSEGNAGKNTGSGKAVFTTTASDARPERKVGKNAGLRRDPGKERKSSGKRGRLSHSEKGGNASLEKAVRRAYAERTAEHSTQKKTLVCDAVIICTGGLAGPSFGCSGDGYRMAEQFSHHILKPLPALTQLVCDSPFIKRAAGVRCQAKISLYGTGRRPEKKPGQSAGDTSVSCLEDFSADTGLPKSGPAAVETGELQITEYGISGIPVFQLSRTAARLLDAGQSVRVSIDFLPEMTDAMFAEEVDRRLRQESRDQMLSDFLLGLAHRKVIDMILAADDRQAEMKAKRIPDERLRFYMEQLRGFPLPVTGTRSFDSAQVTCGGVPVGEIDDRFASVYCPGLYFAGEVLDVDGRCGGYNLQWAMTSGTLAGRAAAE